MRTSEKGYELIKTFEGCKLYAYLCPAGVWTIGYGHTAGVSKGDYITQTEADLLLKNDVAIFEEKVNKYSSYGFNQNEFDALVSFAFNIGSIDQLTNKGKRTREEIAEAMLSYNKADGVVLNGLVRRRKAERELFLTPDNDEPSKWAKVDWKNATKEGIVDGTRPKDKATREEVAVMIMRALKGR